MGYASAPYDPRWALRYPRRAALMALAGPGANLALVLLCFVAIRALSVRGVYGLGMRRLPLADWLRLNAPVRFGLVAERARATA